jgi:SAM-dependent methyltransferase
MNTDLANKVNLGGGNDKISGYFNIDILQMPNVDLVCDINEGIPLPDNSVAEIITNHCLEHLDDTVHIMQEIYRICSHGAIVKIKVPYFKSVGAFKDPTHKQFFTEKTFEYFDRSYIISGTLPEYQLPVNFITEKIAYVWSKPWMRYLPFKQSFFLKYFWNIARTIYFELRVVKD